MSPDEKFVTTISTILALGGLAYYYFLLSRVSSDISRSSFSRFYLVLLPPAGFVILFIVLRSYASHDVRNAPNYLYMYSAAGIAWMMWVGNLCLPGISYRDDVLERSNVAAGFAFGGSLLGHLFCYSGGNIGDGPGWWVVVACGLIASAILLISWLILNWVAQLADRITIDRDAACGIRVAGFFCGAGIILGTGVAGDWVSLRGTITDFGAFSPRFFPLLIGAGVIEKMIPVAYSNSGRLVTGYLPAAIYVLYGLANFLTSEAIK